MNLSYDYKNMLIGFIDPQNMVVDTNFHMIACKMWNWEQFYDFLSSSAAIWAAILDFGLMDQCYVYRNMLIGFLGPQNMVVDTKFNMIAWKMRKLEQF